MPVPIIILITVLIIAYYLIIAYRSEYESKYHKQRSLDILIFGVIIWSSNKINLSITISPLELAGILIFVYGWIIVIYEQFKIGKRQNSSEYKRNGIE